MIARHYQLLSQNTSSQLLLRGRSTGLMLMGWISSPQRRRGELKDASCSVLFWFERSNRRENFREINGGGNGIESKDIMTMGKIDPLELIHPEDRKSLDAGPEYLQRGNKCPRYFCTARINR